jgi:DNA repair exonuclease SbcCD ATPase subunit
MKIIQFNAENIKRLVAVEIRPGGHLVEITGKNGQGKTSILDAIWWALSQNKVVQAKPIREGAENGFVRLDLGDCIVTKKFKYKADGEVTITLTVENRDGAKYGSPQELLNGFLGDLTFDPLAFSRMKPREQVVALRALVPGYDFAAAEKSNKEDFDARTDVNRTVRDLGVRIADISVPDDTPEEPVSVEDLMADLQKAMDVNSAVDAAEARRTRISDRIIGLETSIATRRNTIKEIEAGIAAAEQDIEELRDELDSIRDAGEKVDIEPIRLRITQSEETNRRVDRRKRRATLQEEHKAAEAQSLALTKAIDDRKAAAAKAVREAKLPVKGLELTEEAILLNGQPFDQASDAEQLRVSIAVAGAMNPKLRVIRVRDGSLLDDDSMAALTSYAEENDLQIWLESVQSGRDTAVVIENGMVASHLEAAE